MIGEASYSQETPLDDSGEERKCQAQVLCELAAGLELFSSPTGEPFASIAVEGHLETWSLRSRHVRHWLVRKFYQKFSRPPGGQAVSDALNVLEARALYEGEIEEVYCRVAGNSEVSWYDQGDPDWQTIEIDSSGWRYALGTPARFQRNSGMLPLCSPVTGGWLHDLRQFFPVDDAGWKLLVAFMTMALRPKGPYPILQLHGEQGSGKSTVARLLRLLIDPNSAPLRAEPRNSRDLMIAARNSWLLTFDNLSAIRPWLSDALCRLSTGGGFSTRQLYSDSEELIINVMRPVVLTGIEELGNCGDLLERSILLELAPIEETTRVPEESLYREFNSSRAKLIGSILDTLSAGLGALPHVEAHRLPRMADFARWGIALERPLGWQPGSFLRAYAGNQAASHYLSLDGDPVAEGLHELLKGRESWEGTVSELLRQLGQVLPETVRQHRAWPRTAKGLGGRLKRLAPDLRALGIEITYQQRTGQRRPVLIRKRPASLSSLSHLSSQSAAESLDDKDDKCDKFAGASNKPAWEHQATTMKEEANVSDGVSRHQVPDERGSTGTEDGDDPDY